MYRLAVVIPTFDRREHLAPLLDALLDQEAAEDIQIVITDNASTDGTEELCRRYESAHPQVKYVRFSENRGPDRNFLSCVEHADAEYCWLFGSDDLPRRGAAARVLATLQKEDPDILLFDRVWCDYWMKPARIDRFLTFDAQCSFDTTEPAEVKDYLEASNGLCALLSFLSSVVVRKSSWDAVPPMDEYLGSAYIHTAKLLGVFAAGSRVVYLPAPLVLCRGDNETLMEHGLFNRARVDFVWYSRLVRQFFPREPLLSPALGVIRREFTLPRLLLLLAHAHGQEPFELLHYMRVFRYPALTRLAVCVPACIPPLRWLLKLAAPPARALWWRRTRSATGQSVGAS